MRLIHVRFWEIDIVGSDKRQTHRIGHLYVPPLCQTLSLRRTAVAGVTLQLDIEPVAERPHQTLHQRLRPWTLASLQETPHRTIWSAAQADHTFGMALQFAQRHMRQTAVAAQVEARVELHQVLIAALVLPKQDQRRWWLCAFTRRERYVVQIDLTAHDRLHACPLRAD